MGLPYLLRIQMKRGLHMIPIYSCTNCTHPVMRNWLRTIASDAMCFTVAATMWSLCAKRPDKFGRCNSAQSLQPLRCRWNVQLKEAVIATFFACSVDCVLERESHSIGKNHRWLPNKLGGHDTSSVRFVLQQVQVELDRNVLALWRVIACVSDAMQKA